MGNCLGLLRRTPLTKPHLVSSVAPKMAKPPPVDVYLQAEFQSMDTNKHGFLTPTEFANLMVYLGCNNRLLEKLMEDIDPDKDAKIQEKDFIIYMHKYPGLIKNTNIIRGLFQKFDKDNSGSALKTDVVADLKEMGIYNDKIHSKIEAMDHNKDGNISYRDFLRIYLSGK
ncbi:calcium-dependent protein kinase 12 isoform X1 [Octopus sinensis]|uniref:Calcium-dependent protein kinase 12 isoform X1 n=2 Tax=Octopus sinensis TaxID=2607531 RepID=A0A6P7SBK6_9MOLL|nr:calcium-dependent protein kinase 12 isoform X1 [Octopus sinensis]